MAEKVCPTCKGTKVIPGNCECHPEWRTADGDGSYDDCHCEPDQPCPDCNGTGKAPE